MSSVPKDSHPPPLQVYNRRQFSHHPQDDSLLIEPNIPIVILKGIRSTCNPSPHYSALSYHRLSQPFYTCLSSISFVSIPKFVGDALTHPSWHHAMLNEMSVLQNNETLNLVALPCRKSVVGCRWVFAIIFSPDGTIDRLKVCLVAKGYTQVFGLDYGDTFSPVTKMVSICLFIAIIALQ